MKVLIIRFSSIGDIVLTTPVIRGLAEQSGAEVHFLTLPSFAPVVQENPHISKVWLWEKPFKSLMTELEQERFDWVIDLHHNLRTLRVKRTLRRPSRSFCKLNLEKWLMVRFKYDRLPRIHIVDRYMETVDHLGVKNDGKGLDFFVGQESRDYAEDLCTRVNNEPFCCVALGAAHATKQIPESKLKEFISGAGIPIVLIGGPGERELGESLSGLGAINLAGNASLAESAAVIRRCTWMVTPDTGMMHIAAAFNKPMISVWGNTIPEFGMYAYYADHALDQGVEDSRQEVLPLSCRPCSKIGFGQCPKKHFKCMMDQDPGAWIEVISAETPNS